MSNENLNKDGLFLCTDEQNANIINKDTGISIGPLATNITDATFDINNTNESTSIIANDSNYFANEIIDPTIKQGIMQFLTALVKTSNKSKRKPSNEDLNPPIATPTAQICDNVVLNVKNNKVAHESNKIEANFSKKDSSKITTPTKKNKNVSLVNASKTKTREATKKKEDLSKSKKSGFTIKLTIYF
jgi:hypothetical protein